MGSMQNVLPGELRVFFNHIYEYQKGVRKMILCTLNKTYEEVAINRLKSQNICYITHQINKRCVNIFFGDQECIDAIRLIIDRSLTTLTPEEDFILGTLLGYDLCKQCKRFCLRKQKIEKQNEYEFYQK